MKNKRPPSAKECIDAIASIRMDTMPRTRFGKPDPSGEEYNRLSNLLRRASDAGVTIPNGGRDILDQIIMVARVGRRSAKVVD